MNPSRKRPIEVLKKSGQCQPFSKSKLARSLNHLSIRRVVDLKVHRELVTATAILLMFCCGLLVKTGPVLLAAFIAGIVAVILHLKAELHGIASRFNRDEIRSILQFVLLTLVILPVIPNKTYGSYDFFNPYNVWLMVVLIVGIGLVGYLMHKYFGDKAGVFLCGLFGGLLSSTATTLSYSKKNIESAKDSTWFSAIVILIAWATLYWRVFLELAITSPDFNSIRIPLILMSITSIIPLLWTWGNNKTSFSYSQIPPNPSELKTALIFALMYAGVLLASSILKEKYGSSGLNVLAVIFGITDVDAITLSTGRLVKTGQILESEGHSVILIAIVSNVIFKGLVVGIVGGEKLLKLILLPWIITLIVGISLVVASF